MSRSCARVISPSPARSTLITSARSHARSCVQVGPDCTWVKSRMRTPSRARPACPNGLVEGFGRPEAADWPPARGGAFGLVAVLVAVLATALTDFLTALLTDFLVDFLAEP